MSDYVSDLAREAEQMRQAHLAAHDVANALTWDQLKPSEQARWLLEAGRRSVREDGR